MPARERHLRDGQRLERRGTGFRRSEKATSKGTGEKCPFQMLQRLQGTWSMETAKTYAAIPGPAACIDSQMSPDLMPD